jgi:hypothetical protein
MYGEQPTIADGLGAAMSRLPLILAWAVVSATVGVILRVIEDRSKLVGQIIAGLLGVAWTMLTFLVVPVIVVERKGPVEAFKTSASLLKRTWGEQIIGNFSFGVTFLVLSIPGIIAIVAGIALAASILPLGIAVIVLGVLYIAVLGLVQAALEQIFRASLYLHTTGGPAPDAFPADLLSGAVSTRG